MWALHGRQLPQINDVVEPPKRGAVSTRDELHTARHQPGQCKLVNIRIVLKCRHDRCKHASRPVQIRGRL
ncbi:hypothetical protein Q31a_07530 [Aureliella helgolandensis]|uniref:Uncharacterized protein n=1 Tax=Aureliella helgolandensis TaxID=2527968 RepID=A0A518G1J0_9BACT|nr:hypothetical protein Q31a_07530 [Aureliella helgolandensis]